ncbi:hypothetical protein PQO03_09765 [Lentisphaera profundi]|uniref:BatD protein n=1 Tax=Lentisphaera profundi TaxID=1658616 RepID=A0ABY7VRR8_9BACT|nr:hypothetical protein [Lentisphaera profundi]WDE95999.1 hypothetical protein PQO03_09765 [Lentisphaera profundi]
MKYFALISLFFSCLLSAEIRHQYTLPNNTDELGQLYISSDTELKFTSLPKIDSLLWGRPSVSSRSSIFNGRRSYTSSITIPFKVLKPGPFTIPKLTLATHEIASINFEIKKSPYDQIYFIKTEIIKDSKKLYPGQYFRLKTNLYFQKDYAIQGDFSFPELEAEGIKLRTFANRSSGNQHIESVEQNEVEFMGNKFNVVSLTYVASALISGDYKATVNHQARLAKRSTTPGTGRPVSLQRQHSFPEIKITILPPAPKDTINTRLVGTWQLSSSADKEEVEVGKPFTLNFTFSSKDGDPERFLIPQQQFKFFRLLSEERTIENQVLENLSAKQKLILAALGSDVKIPAFNFVTFDPIQEKYHSLKAHFSSIKFKGEKFKEAPKVAPRVSPVKKDTDRTLQVQVDERIRLPLIANIHPILLILASLLPLAFFLKAYIHVKPTTRAMQEKKLRQIRRILKKSNPEKSHNIYKDHLVPLLKQIYLFSSGDSNNQVIQKISNTELKQILTRYENQRFQKGADKVINGKSLSKALKALSFFFLCMLPFASQAQNEPLKSSTEYIKLLEKEPENISYTLNTALALVEEKNHSLAYAYSQRITRMAPRLERNNELATQLRKTLKQVPSTTPFLRPDELWTMAIYLWITAFFLLCIYRKISKTLITVIFSSALLISVWAYLLTQSYWRDNQYIVINKSAKSYSSVNGSQPDATAVKYLATYSGQAQASQRVLIIKGEDKIWLERKDLFKVW